MRCFLWALLILTPRHVSSSQLLPWDWSGSQWNSNTEQIAQYAASKIPVIGSIVSYSIGLFWPQGQPESAFDEMYNQIQYLVDQEIIKNNQKTLTGLLNGIKISMGEYANSTSNSEKASTLLIAINNCFQTLTILQAYDQKQYIPWMVQLSSLHLQLLRERFLFGPELFGDNNSEWRSDLQTYYSEYITWFDTYYPQWRTWRNSQFTGSVSRRRGNRGFQVKDKLTGVDIDICWEITTSYSCKHLYPKPKYSMSQYLHGTISAMQTEAQTQMIATTAPIFYLWKFVPWLVDQYGEDGPPILPSFASGQHTLGPYASWGHSLVGVNVALDIWDQPGIAINSSVWDYGQVGQFQINYEGHAGKYLNIPHQWGQHSSVVFESFAGPNAYLQGLDCIFYYYSEAGVVGKMFMYINRGKANLNDSAVWYVDGYGGCCGTVNLTMGPRWQMVALGQSRRGSATSNGDGISAIAAKFMYNYTASATFGLRDGH